MARSSLLTASLILLGCRAPEVTREAAVEADGAFYSQVPDAEDGSALQLLHRVPAGRKAEEAARRASGATSHLDTINVTAGTGNSRAFSHGNVAPIMARPWGFNHWTVQSRDDDPAWFFHPQDTSFHGIRCTHQPSPHLGDYGHFLILAAINDELPLLSYKAESSLFRPHHFWASLAQDGQTGSMELELTPTMHGAMIRASFPPDQEGRVHFVLPEGAQGWEHADGALVGHTDVQAWDAAPNFTMWIVVEQVRPDPEVRILAQPAEAVFIFPRSVRRTEYTLRLATSFIDATYARASLVREMGAKKFEEVLEESRATWSELLSRVDVEFPDPARSAVFYTNLYRSMLFPRFFWEYSADGAMVHYSAYTGKVLPGRAVTDQGFWDAYRTHHPFLGLLFPDVLGEMVDGWVNAYKEAGWLPTWSSPGQRHSMTGTMGDCTLADAIVKSTLGLLSGFNRTEAYEAIRHDALDEPTEAFSSMNLGRGGLGEYAKRGYVPEDADGSSDSASRTLNYYLADASVALAAEALRQSGDAELLRARSGRFTELFDNTSHYFRPRTDDGKWLEPFDPVAYGNGYTEGAAEHYRFEVPHDVPGLVKLMGGKARFCANVQSMFQHERPVFQPGSYFSLIHEMSESDELADSLGMYAQNNQPVHHVLYVAAKAGCSTMAQRYLRLVMRRCYTLGDWCGDEDNGEMSAWYILSALGLYSILPGSDELVLGSPEVSRARLQVPGRGPLTIEAVDNSARHVYVSGVKWNGAAVSGTTVKYTDVAKGGSLVFSMADGL